VRVDVVEPLGMDTMIHFRLGAQRISSLVNPYAVKDAGDEMELMMNMRKMQLIDPISDKVV
jgi:multiple sugar transport system ATP-binding protein